MYVRAGGHLLSVSAQYGHVTPSFRSRRPRRRKESGASIWVYIAVQYILAFVFLKANLHRHARHNKTVVSVSCPPRRCELDCRQLKTVADRNSKFEHVQSNRPMHTGTPDTSGRLNNHTA